MGISAPAFLAVGAWLALAAPALAEAADDPAKDPAVRAVREAFRIEGLGLFDARPARAPGCVDSAIAGMTWCGGGTNYVTAENGTYTRSLGYNVDAAGRVVYIILTRKEFPLARAGFADLLRTLGARYGRPPVTLNFQGKTGDDEEFFSLIAVWGGIKLVRLNEAELRAVAEGRAVGRGHLVDHRQDVRLSARQRDPVYKIEGTAGFIAELRSMTDVRTDVVLRAVFQPAFNGEPAAKPEVAPQYRILPLDPALAYAIGKIRAEEERLAAIERARRAEQERKAAEERARREEAERKAAEARRIEEERKAAEARRLAEERRVEEERKAAIERKMEEDRRIEEERKAAIERKMEEARRIEAERKAAEERKLAEERARREAAERAAEEERARHAEAERKAAEERRAMEEKARKEAAERKAAEDRARREEAERKAAEAKRIAEERARREEAERKAAEERRVIEERFRRAEIEYKATVERARRAEAERKAAEERAQQAETERKAAEERAKRIEAERQAADERRAEERAQERRAEERRLAEERARREEAERKTASERAQREAAERKSAESETREERRAAEDRMRRYEAERAQREEAERKPAESKSREERRIAEDRAPPSDADRPKPEPRRVAEEPARRPADPKIAGVPPGVGGPAPGHDEWVRMAVAQSRNSTANWVSERTRDRISDDVLLQARAIFAVSEKLALEIAFECNVDAGKRLKAYVRAFDARTNAAIPIPAEDGRTSVTRGSVSLDEDAPQTAFMFPERDERQASIVEIPVTDEDIRKNTPRAEVWLRHFRVMIKFRVAQGEAAATIYPYAENLRRVLEACGS